MALSCDPSLAVPRLLALDLDGTLLPESKRLTERTRRVLERMASLGTAVTLATGKFLHLTRTYGEALRLAVPLVALDGARSGGNGTTTVERGMDRETVESLLSLYDQPRWDAFADNGADEMLVRSRHSQFAEAIGPWAERLCEVEHLGENLVAAPGILSFYGQQREIEAVAEDARARFPDLRISVFRSERLGSTRVTFQPRGVSKGSGVESLLAQLGVAPAECLVFGDWHNDLPMFQIGCVNVAMANAVPEVKQLAHYTTEHTCEEDGVARFLERHFLDGA